MKIAQVSVTLLNFTVSLKDGTNSDGTYTRNGNVGVANLTCFFTNYAGCPSPPPSNLQQVRPVAEETKQGAAHTFGELALSAPCGNYTDMSDILKSETFYGYWCRRSTRPQQFAYRFLEYNPDDQQRQYPFPTQRVITASAGPCFQYEATNPTNPSITQDDDGFLAAWSYDIRNATWNRNIKIPGNTQGRHGTTYIYRDVLIPQLATTWACGERCVLVWAHRTSGLTNDPDNTDAFFQCAVTIDDVTNPGFDEQKLPDDMARLAASAIALQGRFSHNIANPIWTQYQFYPFG